MIAPQAFFRPSGTPFSVYNRTTILSELGHEVDIVTYPFGEDVTIKNCAIIRSKRFLGIRSIPPGPSLKKLLLDIPFFFAVRRQAKKQQYDALFTHEEGALLGRWLRRKYRIPHVYDMHSFIPIMIEEWGVSKWRIFYHLGNMFQRFLLRGADIIIVNCRNLQEAVAPLLWQEANRQKPSVVVIENAAALRKEKQATKQEEKRLRQQLCLRDEPVILYTGSFVQLQNLDLLLDSVPYVLQECPKATWVLVGGEPDEIRRLQKRAVLLGVQKNIILKERVPPRDIPAYLQLATIVASPRVRGINVPFKLFSLMESGKPILASRSKLYNSFLDDENAMLADAEPRAFARATIQLLNNKKLREQLARAALAKAKREYTVESYKRKMRAVCSMVEEMRRKRG